MTVIGRVQADTSRSFYFWMCTACAAIAFIGFAPSYFRPLVTGSFKGSPIIHVHGMVFFAWSLFLVFQAWLVNSGQVMRHRAVGMIGISIATAMVMLGFLASVHAMKMAASIGMKDQGLSFAIVPLGGIAFFAVTFTLAIMAVRRPQDHKSYILLAAISILDAAVARWFIVFLAPPDAVGPPPVAVTVPPAFVAYVPLLAIALVHDWRATGRINRVLAIGGAVLITLKLLNLVISTSAPWHAFAGGLLAMAQ